MNTIEQVIAEAEAYAKTTEEQERREGEAYQKADAERRQATKVEILGDLANTLPQLIAWAGYVTVEDLAYNHQLNHADNAQVLVRFPECEIIAFWVAWSKENGWDHLADNHYPFSVYSDVEEWWDHNGRSFTDFRLALAYAHEAYPARLAREAEEAARREQWAAEEALRATDDHMRAEYLMSLQVLDFGGHPLPLGASLSDHIKGLLRRLRQYELVNRQ